MSAVNESVLGNIWAVTNTQKQNLTDDEQKTQFIYRHIREEFIKFEKNIDRKKSDKKDTWTDIFQLIGFFSVFQGVWFQGVTQLAGQRTCRFYVIPVVLSVLVSVATLVGGFVKFAKVRDLQEGFYKDKVQSMVLESLLSRFGRDGLKFKSKKADESSKSSLSALTTLFEAQLVKAHWIKVKKQLKYGFFTMSVKAMVVNSCGSVVTVMEGNAGVSVVKRRLNHGDSYSISFDPNSTYREFALVIEGADIPLIVSSDDVIEYSTITCVRNPSGQYDWDGTRRAPKKATTRTEIKASGPGWRITRFFKSLLTGNSSLG